MNKFLREIAEIGAGQGAPQGDSSYCTDGIPFVKAGNMESLTSGGLLNDIQKVAEDVAKAHKLKLYPMGTILFAKSGMSCLKGYVYVLPQEAYVVSHLACITPKEDISEYLRYYFGYHKPNQLVKDAAYPSISLADIGSLEIDLKDENARKHIISTLQAVEGIIKHRNKELQHLDELIKARFVEMFGDQFKGSMIKVGDIADVYIGLTYKPENVSEKGTIVLRSGNIQNQSLQVETDVVRVSGIKIADNKYVKDKDILMCARNGSARLVGKSCLIRNPKEEMAFGAFMSVIRTEYPYFLQGFFSSDYFKNQLTNVGTTSVNQITSKMLNNYNVIMPTKGQEEEFSVFCSQVDKSKLS